MISTKNNIDNEWTKMLANEKYNNDKKIENIKKEQLPRSYIIWDEILDKEEEKYKNKIEKLELETMKIEDKKPTKKTLEKDLIKSKTKQTKKNNEPEINSFSELLSNSLPNFITRYF
tara:strand:+ start:1295 stop:1645 length:351 start_codon:yes stop_codon:yes gene_type:complete